MPVYQTLEGDKFGEASAKFYFDTGCFSYSILDENNVGTVDQRN